MDTLFELPPAKGLNTFEAASGPAARDTAVRQVKHNADPDWMEEAIAAVLRVAMRLRFFTSDDVWAEMAHSSAVTHEPRALGAVMQAAFKEKYCVPTAHWQTSKRRACHARPLRVWKSQIATPM